MILRVEETRFEERENKPLNTHPLVKPYSYRGGVESCADDKAVTVGNERSRDEEYGIE